MASQTRNVATGSVSHRQGRRRFVRRALARSKALFRHQTPGGGISRYLADRDKHRVTQHLIRRLQSLGVEVEVKVA